MKIHIHTPSFFPSLVGMTYATHVHASLLQELGADVTVIAPRIEQNGISEAVDYRVRHFDVSGSGLPWSKLRGDIDGLLRFNAEDRPDIVIVEGWFTTASALLPQLAKSCRHAVLSSHGSADFTLKSLTAAQFFRSLSYRWIEPREQRRVGKVISAAILLSDYRDEDRFRDARVFASHDIPTYICPNPSTYSPASTPIDARRRHTMLHIGSLTPLKNQLLAVQVLAKLPQSFHLLFAYPEWNAYGEQVLAAAKNLQVHDRINLIEGKDRAELETTFDTSGILLITSKTEAQPIIAADALRKGIPFVSTNVGCMPQFRGGRIAGPNVMHSAVLQVCQDVPTYNRYSADAIAYYNDALDRQHAQIALQAMLQGMDRK